MSRYVAFLFCMAFGFLIIIVFRLRNILLKHGSCVKKMRVLMLSTSPPGTYIPACTDANADAFSHI